ncbi:unnamed protein product [Cuscuta campestris]|uniref:Uncharacterized protein n=1 Tax=Cuscuta campestris TaxID=132261 RepID=A0A484LR62_9ASTE|nr:unnamed protein product [Cuscuta campestris]
MIQHLGCTDSALHCRLAHRNRLRRGFAGGDGSWRTRNGSTGLDSSGRNWVRIRTNRVGIGEPERPEQ